LANVSRNTAKQIHETFSVCLCSSTSSRPYKKQKNKFKFIKIL